MGITVGALGAVGISQLNPGVSNGVQIVPAAQLNHGSRTTSAGTRVQLAASQQARSVLVVAMVTNTGYVYVGGPLVSSASYGKRLKAGEPIIIEVQNLNLIWFDVSVNGEGVTYLFLV